MRSVSTGGPSIRGPSCSNEGAVTYNLRGRILRNWEWCRICLRPALRLRMTSPALPSSPLLPLADGLSREFLLHHGVCPKELTAGGALVVALAPNAREEALDDIGFAYQRRVVTEAMTLDVVERLIERLTNRAERAIELERADHEDTDDGLTTDVRDLANQPPVVRYVNLLVRDAYDAKASDIHLEAGRMGLAVRFRLDGVLTAAAEPPAELQHAVVSRIKLLAELDIAERRRPQDGRIRVRLEARELDP